MIGSVNKRPPRPVPRRIPWLQWLLVGVVGIILAIGLLAMFWRAWVVSG